MLQPLVPVPEVIATNGYSVAAFQIIAGVSVSHSFIETISVSEEACDALNR